MFSEKDLPFAYLFFLAKHQKDKKQYNSGYSEVYLFEKMDGLQQAEDGVSIIFNKAILEQYYKDDEANLCAELKELFTATAEQLSEDIAAFFKEEPVWVKNVDSKIIGCSLPSPIVENLKNLGYSMRAASLSESICLRMIERKYIDYYAFAKYKEKLIQVNEELETIFSKELEQQYIENMAKIFSTWCLNAWKQATYKDKGDKEKRNKELNQIFNKYLDKSNLNEFLNKVRLPNYVYLDPVFSSVLFFINHNTGRSYFCIHNDTFVIVKQECVLEFKNSGMAKFAAAYIDWWLEITGKEKIDIGISSQIAKPNTIQFEIAKLCSNYYPQFKGGRSEVGLESDTLAIPSDRLLDILEGLCDEKFGWLCKLSIMDEKFLTQCIKEGNYRALQAIRENLMNLVIPSLPDESKIKVLSEFIENSHRMLKADVTANQEIVKELDALAASFSKLDVGNEKHSDRYAFFAQPAAIEEKQVVVSQVTDDANATSAEADVKTVSNSNKFAMSYIM